METIVAVGVLEANWATKPHEFKASLCVMGVA